MMEENLTLVIVPWKMNRCNHLGGGKIGLPCGHFLYSCTKLCPNMHLISTGC